MDGTDQLHGTFIGSESPFCTGFGNDGQLASQYYARIDKRMGMHRERRTWRYRSTEDRHLRPALRVG